MDLAMGHFKVSKSCGKCLGWTPCAHPLCGCLPYTHISRTMSARPTARMTPPVPQRLDRTAEERQVRGAEDRMDISVKSFVSARVPRSQCGCVAWWWPG